MKKIIIPLCVAFVTSCAPNPGPVFLNLYATKEGKCPTMAPADGDPLLGAGFTDLAGSTSFLATFQLKSAAKSESLLVGTTVIEPANRDNPVLEEKVLTYTTTPKRGTFKEEHIKFANNSFSALYGIDNFIGPLAATNIVENDLVPTGDTLLLNVTVRYKGHMSGSGAAWDTGPYNLPITIVNSGCTPFFDEMTSVCGVPGQGHRVACQ